MVQEAAGAKGLSTSSLDRVLMFVTVVARWERQGCNYWLYWNIRSCRGYEKSRKGRSLNKTGTIMECWGGYVWGRGEGCGDCGMRRADGNSSRLGRDREGERCIG